MALTEEQFNALTDPYSNALRAKEILDEQKTMGAPSVAPNVTQDVEGQPAAKPKIVDFNADQPQDQVPSEILEAEALNQMGSIQQQSAIESQMLAKQQEDLARANQLERQSSLNQAFADLQTQRREQHLEELGKEERLLKEYKKSADATKIDPNRFFNNATTGQKIMMGIGLALAGAGGQGQTALNAIMQNIDNDIESQKLDLVRKEKRVEGQRNIINDMRRLYKDDKQAIEAARLLKIEATKDMLKSQIAKSESNVERAKGVQLLGKLNMEMAKTRENMLKLKDKFGGKGQMSVERKLSELGSEEKKAVSNMTQVLGSIDEMEKALNQGVNTFSIVGDNPYTLNRKTFVDALARLQSGAAISEKEFELYSSLAPTWKDTEEIQQMKIQKIRKLMNERINNYGIDPNALKSFQSGGVSFTPNK